MSNPLIILGAGASHDFTHPVHLGLKEHKENPVFPLTDGLVTNVDHDIESLYDGFKVIRSRISSSVISGRKSFEECLEGWDNHEQLSGLLLYLGDFFWKRSHDERVELHPSNFSALIDIINENLTSNVNFVTFNYDLLLERAIDSSLKKFFNLQDYINGPIRIIKIHGSCDWFNPMSKVGNNAYTTLKDHPEFLSKPNKQILTKRWWQQENSGAHQFFLIPVISMPTTVTKSFACPYDHMELLMKDLPETQKVLIIGWKAADTFFLEQFKKIENPIDLTVVSGSKKGVEETTQAVEKYVKINKKVSFVGFSDFIGSNECESFFSKKV